MRRILPSLPFLLLSALCLSQTLFALNGGPEISGSVNDPTGAVIQGAKVELIVHNEKISTAVTDHEGYYSLPVSAAGTMSPGELSWLWPPGDCWTSRLLGNLASQSRQAEYPVVTRWLPAMALACR